MNSRFLLLALLIMGVTINSTQAQQTIEAAKKCLKKVDSLYKENNWIPLDSGNLICLNQAISAFEENLADYHLEYSTCKYLRANHYYIKSKPSLVEKDLLSSIDILKAFDSTGADSLITSLYIFANILYTNQLFDYDKAMTSTSQALEYAKKANFRIVFTEIYLNAAFTQISFNQCKLAEGYLKNGKRELEKAPTRIKMNMSPFAEYMQGRLEICQSHANLLYGDLEVNDSLIQMARKRLLKLVPMMQFGGQLNELAIIYHVLGSSYLIRPPVSQIELDSAVFFLEKSAKFLEKSPTQFKQLIYFMKSLKQVSEANPDSAFHLLNSLTKDIFNVIPGKLMEVEKATSLKPMEYQALQMISYKVALLRMLSRKEKKKIYLEQIVKDCELLVNILQRIRIGYSSENSALKMGESYHYFLALGANIANQLFQEYGDASYVERGLAIAEQTKSMVLRQAVHQKKAKFEYKGELNIIHSENLRRQALIRNLGIQYQEMEDPTKKEAIKHKIWSEKEKLSSFLGNLKNGSYAEQKYYRERIDNSVPSISRIQSWLSDNTAIVEYTLGLDSSCAFIITKDKVKSVSLERYLFLKDKVALYEEGLIYGASDFQTSSYDLYQAIMEEVEKKIDTTVIKRLIIIPDNILWSVSFEALANRPQGREAYLVRQYDFSYAFSLSMLLYAEKNAESTPQNKIGVFTSLYKTQDGVNYSDHPCLGNLPPLNAMNKEANDLANTLEYSQLFQHASKRKFLESAKHYDGLVVIAHGCVDEQMANPLDYSIAFSNNLESAKESMLTARQIYNLDLSNVNWAFLGVCNIAWGKLRQGEGLASLARAFAYAGCSSLIISRHQANDMVVARIMDAFFEHFNKGFDLSASLKKAKEQLCNEGYHPKYWANLICLGNGQYASIKK